MAFPFRENIPCHVTRNWRAHSRVLSTPMLRWQRGSLVQATSGLKPRPKCLRERCGQQRAQRTFRAINANFVALLSNCVTRG
eukprot:4114702-Pyramimonas_sp.AAC.1